MPDDHNMIQVKNLCFTYSQYSEETDSREELTALTDINMTIKKGEFVAILGHNGSGKSTLAKLFNGLLTPTSGCVLTNGLDTNIPDNIWRIRQSAGMVFQNPDNQIIATIVEEDIAFGPENLGIEPAEIRRRVEASLAAVDMSDFREYSPHFLSGGQKQRIAIAGVLAMKPELIILDEPTAMLDPIGRKDVMNTILTLNREENITIVLITHYMDEAVQAGRVIVMEDGRMVMDATPKNVFKQVDKIKSLSLDVPQVTELMYKLRLAGIQIPDDILSIEEMVDALCQLK